MSRERLRTYHITMHDRLTKEARMLEEMTLIIHIPGFLIALFSLICLFHGQPSCARPMGMYSWVGSPNLLASLGFVAFPSLTSPPLHPGGTTRRRCWSRMQDARSGKDPVIGPRERTANATLPCQVDENRNGREPIVGVGFGSSTGPFGLRTRYLTAASAREIRDQRFIAIYS